MQPLHQMVLGTIDMIGLLVVPCHSDLLSLVDDFLQLQDHTCATQSPVLNS